MRKWIVLCVFFGALTIGTKNAGAQTEISLGAINTDQSINFASVSGTGSGAVVSMSFGECGSSTTCTLSTVDTFVVGGSPVGVGTGTLGTTAAAVYTLTSTSPVGATWSVAGPSMSYNLNIGSGTIGGTVTWSQVTTDGVVGLDGTIYVTSVTGTLSPSFSPWATYSIDYQGQYSPASDTLEAIDSGAYTSATAALPESGAISPTPEPASCFLFGTGLLSFAGILRRKFIA